MVKQDLRLTEQRAINSKVSADGIEAGDTIAGIKEGEVGEMWGKISGRKEKEVSQLKAEAGNLFCLGTRQQRTRMKTRHLHFRN